MRITFVHSGALGDTILLLPLLKALKLRFPSSELSMVMRPAFGQLFVMHGFATAWHSADESVHSRWFGPVGGAEEEKALPPWADCDLLISAVSNGQDPWAQNAAAAMNNRAAPADWAGPSILFFNPRPPPEYPYHVTRFHREQLQAQGLVLPEIPAARPAINPDGRVYIHPGSGGDAKCWPRENFLQLGADLQRNGIIPTMILGEAEADRWGRAEIEKLESAYPTLFHVGMYELSDKLARGRLYLGNDSGVTHLAAAMRVPTLALYGPSNERQWAPVGPEVRILTSPERADLASLPVRDVLWAMMEELAGTKRAGR